MNLEKYKDNLHVDNNEIYSYNTEVAQIYTDKIVQDKKWSSTTQKHINYVAEILDLPVIKEF